MISDRAVLAAAKRMYGLWVGDRIVGALTFDEVDPHTRALWVDRAEATLAAAAPYLLNFSQGRGAA